MILLFSSTLCEQFIFYKYKKSQNISQLTFLAVPYICVFTHIYKLFIIHNLNADDPRQPKEQEAIYKHEVTCFTANY